MKVLTVCAILFLIALSDALSFFPEENHVESENNRYYMDVPSIQQAEQTWAYREVKALGVSSLGVGQVFEVVFKTPNSGRVSVNLRADNNDYILHVDIRIAVFHYKDKFILTRYSPALGWNFQEIAGFPFTCPPVSTTVTVRITVRTHDMLVEVNDMSLATFPFEETLTADKVSRVECALGDISAPIKGSVEKISTYFSYE